MFALIGAAFAVVMGYVLICADLTHRGPGETG
jgi:hypothetical protein